MSTNTITMTGNSTGYGLFSGSEVFNLTGYDNTVLADGANDTINILDGGSDTVDLNYAHFSGAVTDNVNLGDTAFSDVTSSFALNGADLSIGSTGGPNTISLTNHGGVTDISLGYTGDAAYQHAIGLVNSVTLNGDASNSVGFTAGGYANVAIGAAADGQYGYQSTVDFYGSGNTLTGGDENFNVTDTAGSLTSVTLGNGNSNLDLLGGYSNIRLGNGNNIVSLSRNGNKADFGTGNNTVNIENGDAGLRFAAGDAGANEAVNITGGTAFVIGGDENFDIQGHGGVVAGRLGDGNDTIVLGTGHGTLVVGDSLANTGNNSFSAAGGADTLTFNGGTGLINLADDGGAKGYDNVTLNGTMLGTTLTAYGAFDKVTLGSDANATINDLGVNGGMNFTLDADATGGFGQIVINGLAGDDLAHITLDNASAYTITADNTPQGGITLNFDHGSVDLVGLQSVPNNLIS